MPAGTKIPYQNESDRAGSPASRIPGISGINEDRSGLVTARARRRPAFTIGITEGGVAKDSCVSPATTEVMAGAPPLNGTCTILTPASWPKSAAPKCGAEPMPDVA